MPLHLSTCGRTCPGEPECSETADVVGGATDEQLRDRYGALPIDEICEACNAKPSVACTGILPGGSPGNPRFCHAVRSMAARKRREADKAAAADAQRVTDLAPTTAMRAAGSEAAEDERARFIQANVDLGVRVVDQFAEIGRLREELAKRAVIAPAGALAQLTSGRLDGLVLSPIVLAGKLVSLAAEVDSLPGLRLVLEAAAVRELHTALGLVLAAAEPGTASTARDQLGENPSHG